MPEEGVVATKDREFAKRLDCRDGTVLTEIDAAYSGHLRWLLRRRCGPWLNEADIDEIVASALLETWTGFRPDGGATVRIFYFTVGKRRVQDHLRRAARRDRGLRLAQADLAVPLATSAFSPEEVLIDKETHHVDPEIRRLIRAAIASLTERQRRAFLGRFSSGDGRRWAQQLEKETGVPAKQWRKASDEARARVRVYFDDQGVSYSTEGGRYEIAQARSRA